MPEAAGAIEVDIRIEAAAWHGAVPALEETMDATVRAALECAGLAGRLFELSILLVDDSAIAALNQKWRSKMGPTNVLSFPGDSATPVAAENGISDDGVPVLLGDIVIAFETATAEADAAGISTDNHLRHLVVHGVLHLLGYDHENDEDAERMERCEIEILGTLGVPDPYAAADRRLEHAPR
jgi:probable rRNA maturation factor